MMIFQDIPSIDITCSAYTWDESWILPYESIYSLVHKFSVLNLINLSECKKLFKPENTHEKTITELGSKLSLKKLTEIIGMGSALDKNLVHEIVHQADRAWLFSPYLRTCPICWKLGFHSTFHQVMLVTKCPIHQMDLSNIACKSCGSIELYESIKTISNKHDGYPYTCTKCGKSLWHPYDDMGDSPGRNLLTITVEQKEILDALYDWLIASTKAAPFGASLNRWENMAGLLFLPAPIGMVPHQKSIYKLRSHEIPLYRGNIIGLQPPGTVTCTNRRDTIRSVIQYGFKAGNQKTEQHCSSRTNYEPQFNDSRIIYSDAENGLQARLRPVYKSIRRHLAKVFLTNCHRRCARSIDQALWWEPGPHSNTQICPWAFAYLFWRRNWEKRIRVNYPNKYANWKHLLMVKISEDDHVQNEWITLRIFALECYWSFQECVLLARGMHRQKSFKWDNALIRGRLIPYWHIDNQTNPRNPSIYWWSRQPIQFRALRLNIPMKQHSRDVAMQANSIYRQLTF